MEREIFGNTIERGRNDAEQLRINLRHDFLKCPDIRVVEPTIIAPGTQYVFVVIGPQHIAPLTYLANPQEVIEQFTHFSMRSRFAQLGLEPHEETGAAIAAGIDERFCDQKGALTSPFIARVPITNHSMRRILLPDSGAFRAFYLNASTPTTGAELDQLVNKQELEFQGEYGRDWAYMYKNGSNNSDDIVGIRVRLLDTFMWMPPSSDYAPVSIQPTGPQYRDEIDKLLVKPPVDFDPRLLIGETIPFKTPDFLETIIVSDVHTGELTNNFSIEDLAEVRQANHIRSHLLDGGTNWNVRVEIQGVTHPSASPKVVELRFVRARRQAA